MLHILDNAFAQFAHLREKVFHAAGRLEEHQHLQSKLPPMMSSSSW
jgi:hypothetical protein